MTLDAWSIAARASDRQPVLLLSVESTNAIKQSITTRADWEAGSVQTNINTSSPLDNPGVVIMDTDGVEIHSGLYFGSTYATSQENDWIVPRLQHPDDETVFYTETPEVNGHNSRVARVEFTVYRDSSGIGGPNVINFEGSLNGGAWETVFSFVANEVDLYTYVTYSADITRGTWKFRMKCPSPSLGFSALLTHVTTYHETRYMPTASTTTKSVDLGAAPTVPSVFGANDIVSAIATLTYTAYGSTDNATWVDLGAVIDGGTMAPYRYYRFKADFTSTGPDTPVLEEINVAGGDGQFLYFSTHEDLPVMGAKPLLKNSIGALNSKLELMKLGSTGEINPKLFYLRDTFELLRDGELRNKVVGLKMGFVGLPEASFEPLFSGLWYDGTIDHYASEVSVKTRTIISRFQKAKIPSEYAAGSPRTEGNVVPKEWINENIISVMLDVMDYLGIQNRWIDVASANAIAAGARSGADWVVSRRMDKDNKEEAVKLLEELSVLAGVFILQSPSGKLYFKLYDAASPIVAEITSDICTFSNVELGQGELFTRQQIFYEPRHKDDLETGIDRGAYANGADYARNDLVTVGAVSWYCLQSHQSSAGTAPGTGAAYRAYWTTDWSTATAYVIGDVRIKDGPLYICKLSHTSSADAMPGTGLFWRDHWTTQPVMAGGSDEDYHSAYILINEAAEITWGLNEDVPPSDPDYLKNPGYQKKWYDKWKASLAAITALAARMDAWFATPKMKLKASDLPPEYFKKVALGDMVGVTGLMLPVAGAEWGTPCTNKKFMVVSKSFDTAACKVALDLLEV